MAGVTLSTPSSPVSVLPTPDQQYSWKSGKKPDFLEIQKYKPNQSNFMDYLLESAQSLLQNPSQGFDPIRQDTLNTFFRILFPDYRQFSASGSNATSSPILQTNISSAGGSLAHAYKHSNLSLNSQNGQQALPQGQLGFGQKSDFIHREGGGGFYNNFLDLIMKAVPDQPMIGGGYLAGKEIEMIYFPRTKEKS